MWIIAAAIAGIVIGAAVTASIMIVRHRRELKRMDDRLKMASGQDPYDPYYNLEYPADFQ